jgi:hypothetical protein
MMKQQTLVVTYDDYDNDPKKFADLSKEMWVFINFGGS